MGGEQDEGHAGGEGEVRGVGLGTAAQGVADGAEDEHADGDGDEGPRKRPMAAPVRSKRWPRERL